MGSNRAVHDLREYGAALLAEEGAHFDLPQQARQGFRWRPLDLALPAAVLIVFGNIGLVAAADGAVPGDLLYPVDRAYERIAGVLGVDTDASSERLAEASVLLAEGRFDTAVAVIAASVAKPGTEVDELIIEAAGNLASADINALDREDLHRSVASLGSAVAALNASGDDPAAWIGAIETSSQAVSEVAAGLPFSPQGHGDDFTPPGQDEQFTPPGQNEDHTPPGQNEQFTPPGQNEDHTPPGQGNKNKGKQE